MEKIIGRSAEKHILNEALASDEAELIVVYGRRRIGKTFLIRHTYRDDIIFEINLPSSQRRGILISDKKTKE